MKVLAFALALTLVFAHALSLNLRHVNTEKVPKHHVRITGGEEVVPHSIPYQVAVIVDLYVTKLIFEGSLISPKVVLSAAHCTDGISSIEVVLGAHKVTEDEDTQIRLTAAEIRVHPDWDSDNFVNDLAILILPEAVELNEYIQTVSLPTSNDNDYEGDLATVSGWGFDSDDANYYSPVLRKVQIPIINNKECSKYYSDSIVGTKMCASGADGKSSCDDNGGPLVASTGEQIGITSLGAHFRCEDGYPPIFTRVSSYLDWINENLRTL